MDPTGKKNGRGAYICRNIQCLEKAFKNKRLQKNLEIQIDETLYDRLREQIESNQ